MLRLENIVKSYENHLAVDNVSFEVPEGAIFGLLGPNGAGKTSLIRIITAITRADSGAVFLNGQKVTERNASQIGYMPEERGLYKKMAVGEQLLYLAQLKGMSYSTAKQEIVAWMTKFEIQDWWDKKIEELSKGMQQKVQFISTVLHRPTVLILDEPFTGLDPLNATLIKDEIFALHEQGTSIIFSTHRMEQVEEICHKIVLINQGKNVLEGEVKNIKNQFKEHIFTLSFEGTLPDDMANYCDVVAQKDQKLTLKLKENIASNEILKHLIQKGVTVQAFNEVLPSLNEIFIRQVSN
jgi:ABC-2 type transport system ATP-binding protein